MYIDRALEPNTSPSSVDFRLFSPDIFLSEFHETMVFWTDFWQASCEGLELLGDDRTARDLEVFLRTRGFDADLEFRECSNAVE